MSYFKHLKQKWNIKSNWDVLLILIVFSLAGMMILHERRPIFHLLGINAETPMWIKVCVYIPIVIPLYQLNLLLFGLLLGQFKFFWNKEKQLVKFLARPFQQRSQI